MCLEAVKPRSFILAQFSEADPLVCVVRAFAGAGGVCSTGTLTLGRIKQPPELSGKEEKNSGELIRSADLKGKDRVLVFAIMIAQAGKNSWSELLTSVLSRKQMRADFNRAARSLHKM